MIMFLETLQEQSLLFLTWKSGKKARRVDYDAKKGGHINWWNGKEKGAIILNAGQNQIDQIIKNGTFK